MKKIIKIEKSSLFDLLHKGKTLIQFEGFNYNMTVSNESLPSIYIFGKKGSIVISKEMTIDLLIKQETSFDTYKLKLI